jgi:hypothetical protein
MRVGAKMEEDIMSESVMGEDGSGRGEIMGRSETVFFLIGTETGIDQPRR